MGEILRPDYLI